MLEITGWEGSTIHSVYKDGFFYKIDPPITITESGTYGIQINEDGEPCGLVPLHLDD